MEIEILKRIVGKELMLSRKERGLTGEELSKKSKIAASTISRYESGQCTINLDIIARLLICLGVDIIIFFNSCFAKMQKTKEE